MTNTIKNITDAILLMIHTACKFHTAGQRMIKVQKSLFV